MHILTTSYLPLTDPEWRPGYVFASLKGDGRGKVGGKPVEKGQESNMKNGCRNDRYRATFATFATLVGNACRNCRLPPVSLGGIGFMPNRLPGVCLKSGRPKWSDRATG